MPLDEVSRSSLYLEQLWCEPRHYRWAPKHKMANEVNCWLMLSECLHIWIINVVICSSLCINEGASSPNGATNWCFLQPLLQIMSLLALLFIDTFIVVTHPAALNENNPSRDWVQLVWPVRVRMCLNECRTSRGMTATCVHLLLWGWWGRLWVEVKPLQDHPALHPPRIMLLLLLPWQNTPGFGRGWEMTAWLV